ncbi:hypothetical protein PMAYCL1PPCAC_33410, partial [Pristionchus mayeri]
LYNTLVYLNSTTVAFAPTLFYFIYGIEVILCSISVFLAPFAALALMRAGVIHRNFRYCVLCAVFQLFLACLSRFFLLFCQILDLPVIEGEDIVASILRDQFLGYISSVLGAVTLERLVATLRPEWYEKEKGTFHVFIVVQIILVLPSAANAILWTLLFSPGIARMKRELFI